MDKFNVDEMDNGSYVMDDMTLNLQLFQSITPLLEWQIDVLRNDTVSVALICNAINPDCSLTTTKKGQWVPFATSLDKDGAQGPVSLRPRMS